MLSKISVKFILCIAFILVIAFPIDTFFTAISKCSFFITSDISTPILLTCSSKIFKKGYAFLPNCLNLNDMYSMNGYFISPYSFTFSLYSFSLLNFSSSFSLFSTSLSIMFSTLYFCTWAE